MSSNPYRQLYQYAEITLKRRQSLIESIMSSIQLRAADPSFDG